MKHTLTILKRELGGYFATPVAYVFLVDLPAAGRASSPSSWASSSTSGNGQADARSRSSSWHAWLYLFLIPAALDAPVGRGAPQGTVELLFTLPVTLWQSVVGKFLAAWAFTGIALALTFPMWITVNALGNPDNGVICASYLGSFLMAGGYLAIGSCISALTKNQVIAFVLSVSACLLFVLAGLPMVLDFISGFGPLWLVDAVRSFAS